MNKPFNKSNVTKPSLVELLQISFDQLGYPQLKEIQCEADGDVMILSGVLKSFYLKQIAQTVAINVPGVSSVRNLIEVE